MNIYKWLYVRKFILTGVLIDIALLEFFLIFSDTFIFNSYGLQLHNLNNFHVNILFSFSWIFFSYLCERYSNIENITLKNKFIRNIIKTLITSIIIFILFCFIGLIFNISSVFFDPKKISILILSSTLIQYFLSKITNLYSEKQIKYLVIYDEKFSEILISFLNEINYFKKYNFTLFNKDVPQQNYQEVIIAKMKLTKLEEKVCNDSIIKNKKISTLTEWCEFKLNAIPPELLTTFEFHQSSFQNNNKGLEIRIKRIFDILISLCLIITTLPIVIIVILIIKIEDGGPIFYSQVRSGFKSINFRIYKLRSMHIKAELDGAQWAKAKDNRITKIGYLIRKTRIDELPQLINVIKGEMSLIGPRPERPEIDKKLTTKIAFYNIRYLAKPGLSGWAQVNYPYGASIKDSMNKLSYDLFYIKNYSIWLDMLIFFKTIKLIFNGKGATPKNG